MSEWLKEHAGKALSELTPQAARAADNVGCEPPQPSDDTRATGCPVDLGETWRLRKADCHGAREAVCRLFSHQLGWELRVGVGSELRRSQVCKTETEFFEMYEAWKAAMLERGWR